ncbi:hypothetical protein [Cohnella mopanensis]|uniref:hypothetical protein n=1 Tax=Cohnella mopanensis TaxID=2911966 RepID=UPI001EF873D2|nr:hypothetical protein [Cohnella mopanensis]
MLLLGIAGVLTSIACAATVVTGFISNVGKALGIVVAAIGITLGFTVGSVAASSGATDVTTAAIGIAAGSLTVIAGNAAIRKRLKKAANMQRHY